MPKKKPAAARDDREQDDDEDEIDDEVLARDYVMARLGGVVASLDATREAVIGSLVLFVNPDDDARGKERKDLLEHALEAVGAATRGLEDASETISEADMEAGEPWEEEDDEEEDED